MSTNHPDRTDDPIAQIVDVFEEMDTPPRPSNEETIEAISRNAEWRTAPHMPLHRRRIMKFMAPLAGARRKYCPGHFVVAVVTEHCICSGNRTNQESRRRNVYDHAQAPGFPDVSGNAYAKSPDLLRYDLKSNGHTMVNITNYAKG